MIQPIGSDHAQGPAQEVAAARRTEPLVDLLGDLPAGQVRGQHAGGLGAARGRRPVRDHDRALQPEQRGPAVALRVHPLAEFPQPAPLQQRAEPGGPGAAQGLSQLVGREGGGPLQGLQGHVPRETVGHDHVDLAGQQVTALDIADEADRQAAVRRVGVEQFVGPPGQLVALARLRADREQPDPRLGDPVGGLRVGHAELRELQQHLRLGVGDRPRVHQQRGRGPGGQHDRERGPEDPGQRPQPEPGGRNDAAGRPGRHHGAGLAPADQLAGHGDARPGAAPARQRALIHRDGVLGRHDRDVGQGSVLGQQGPQLPGPAGQQHRQTAAGRRDGAGHDLVRGMIAAHGVHGDRLRCRPAAHRPAARMLGRRSGALLAAAQRVADRAGWAATRRRPGSRMRSASHRRAGEAPPAWPQAGRDHRNHQVAWSARDWEPYGEPERIQKGHPSVTQRPPRDRRRQA